MNFIERVKEKILEERYLLESINWLIISCSVAVFLLVAAFKLLVN
jgi:hypothetical protein